MKLDKLIYTIEELIKTAGKQFYYLNKELYFEINTPETRFSIFTKEDNTLCTTIYVADGIYYKFFTERDGTLLLEKGSVPDLIENFGINYIFKLINTAAPAMLEIGINAIEQGNYVFRHTGSNEQNVAEDIKVNLH